MRIKRIIKSKQFKKFYYYLNRLSDSHQQTKVKYNQAHIILVIILAMFAGFNKFKEFHAFGIKYENKLIKILGYDFKMCSHDTLERTMHRIKSEELEDLLVNLIIRFFNPNERFHICIDGKAVRATRNGDSKNNATNIVTLYIAGLKLSLYSLSISSEDKTNEIPIIVKLLNILYKKFPDLKVVITIDAIGANNTVLSKIKEYKYDFIICIKDEKRGLCSDIIDEFKCNPDLESIKTIDKGNGRYETRKYYLVNDITNIPNIEHWHRVKKIGKMYSSAKNAITGKLTEIERYFLMSDLTLQEFAH